MVRVFTAAAVVSMVSACAPERAPADHRTWRMNLDVEGSSSCPLQGDAALDVETWIPRNGVELIRFPNAPPFQLGRSMPIVLPEGVRGGASNFSWGASTEVTSSNQRGRVDQAMSLVLSTGDAGVEGVFSLSSRYTCIANCDGLPRYPSCDAQFPVTLTEVDLAPFPIEATVAEQESKTMMTVAVSSSGSCAADVDGNALRFERWSFSEEHVRVATRSGHFGSYVDSKFSGALDLVGDSWFWASDMAPLALPRATVSMPVFDFSKGDAFEVTLKVDVKSNCTSELCPAKACGQTVTAFVMREEKKP